MATSLPASRLVNLTIGLQAAAAPREAFGIPMIADTDNVLSSTAVLAIVKTYATIKEMETDGFKAWHRAHRMARALFAQSPRVEKIKVSGVFAGVVSSATLTLIDVADPKWYALLITSRTSADLQAAATWCETVSTLRHVFVGQTIDTAAMTAGASVLSILKTAGRQRASIYARKAKAQTLKATITQAFVAGNTIDLTVNGGAIVQVPFNVTSDTTLADLATALQGTASIATATVTAVAGGTENDRVIEIVADNELVEVTIGGIVIAGGASQPVLAVAETGAAGAPVDASIVGKVIPFGAGQATYFGKTLSGVVADSLSTAEADNVQAQNGNWYGTIGGKDLSVAGTSSADIAPSTPLFLDLVTGIDAFETDLQDGLIAVLTPAKKLPFNNAGIAAVVGAIGGIAQRYVGAGFLEPYEFADAFTFPDISQVAAGDKSTRVLNGITANFVATGAIQKIGNLTINVKA